MNRNSTNYSNFYNEIVTSIRGAEIYENTEEQYIELPIITDENIAKAKEIISKYGYYISKETEADGSDYPAYYIWFGELEYTERAKKKSKHISKNLRQKEKKFLMQEKTRLMIPIFPHLKIFLMMLHIGLMKKAESIIIRGV